MASYVEVAQASGKLDWAMSFQRTGTFPLDRSSMFGSYADAVLYAKGTGADSRQIGGTAYIGQVISVYEDDVVTVYKIDPSTTPGELGVLTEVGRATLGDGVSIVLNDSTRELSIAGFEAATEGQQLVVAVEDGVKKVKWITPDNTTVEGLSTKVAALESKVGTEAEGTPGTPEYKASTGLIKRVDDHDAKIADIEGKLTGALHYKGSKTSIQALRDEVTAGTIVPVAGDVYNIETAGGYDDHNVYINAGDNVIWNGTGWDASTGTIDLSNYYTKTEVDDAIDADVAAAQQTLQAAIDAVPVVTASTTNGNVVIDETETTVYTLPTATTEALGGIKVSAAGTADKVVVDATGVAGIDKVSGSKVDGSVASASKVDHKIKIGTKEFDGSAEVTIEAADIPVPTDVVRNTSYATSDVGGVVKSSTAQDGVAVSATGEMTVNNISASKVQGSVDSAKKVDNALTIGGKTFDGSAAVSVAADDIIPNSSTLIHSTDIAGANVGVVKSTDGENGIVVAADGTMSVNSINPNKLSGAALDSTKLGGVAATDILVAGADTNLTSKVKAAAAADKLATAHDIELTGDATGSASFDGSADASIAVTLANSGVTAGTYTKVTVDAKGRVTSGVEKIARADISSEFEADLAALEGSNHSHDNKTVLDGITQAKVNNWDADHTKLTATDNTLSSYGITDAYTKAEVDGIVGSAFYYKDSYPTFAALEAAVAVEEFDLKVGYVYNIVAAGGTDSNGTAIKAGDNVVCKAVATEDTPAQWDVLAGTVDLTNYYTKNQTDTAIDNAVGHAASGDSTPATGLHLRVDTLESTVGSADGGLVKDVNALKTTVGDAASGLVKDVAGLKTDVAGLKTTVGDDASGLVKKVNDIEAAIPGQISDAVEASAVTKQNKVFQKTLVVTPASFAAASDTEPGEFVGTFAIADIDDTKNYKVDVVPVIDTVATHKAIVAAGFLPMTSFEGNTLKLFTMVAPTAQFNVSLTFTEIQ